MYKRIAQTGKQLDAREGWRIFHFIQQRKKPFFCCIIMQADILRIRLPQNLMSWSMNYFLTLLIAKASLLRTTAALFFHGSFIVRITFFAVEEEAKSKWYWLLCRNRIELQGLVEWKMLKNKLHVSIFNNY